MSFVLTAPDVLATESGNLAGIGSTLRDAAAAAAGPTSNVTVAAADEVSAAISQLFGSYGTDFQALSTRAAAFHAEFVSLLNGGAAAYLGTEVANAANTADSILPLPILGGGGTSGGGGGTGGGLGGVLGGLGSLLGLGGGSTGTTAPPPNPYQTLFANTGANLQKIVGTWNANPFPALHQIVVNQQGYAQLVTTAWTNAVQSFPAGLPVVSGQVQAAIRSASGFDPLSFAQWFAARQAGYGQTVSTALTNAIQDLPVTLPTFQHDVGLIQQDVMTGDYHGAVNAIPGALVDLFLKDVDLSNLSTIEIHGPAGDLVPVLDVLTGEQQDFINLLPPASTIQHIVQNGLNAVTTVSPSLGYALIGPPIAGLDGLATGATMLGTAVQAGNIPGALGALANLPAYTLNGFLNGQPVIDLTIHVTETIDLPGLPPIGPSTPIVAHVPFDGLLVQPQPITATIYSTVPVLGVHVPIATVGYGSTQFGGLIPELVSYIPQQIASVLSGASQQIGPITVTPLGP